MSKDSSTKQRNQNADVAAQKATKRKAKREAKKEWLKLKIARRVALQEEDERLGRKSPPPPTTASPRDKVDKALERERRLSVQSSMGKLLTGGITPINKGASQGISFSRPRKGSK